jgi:hypothetical protein
VRFSNLEVRLLFGEGVDGNQQLDEAGGPMATVNELVVSFRVAVKIGNKF